MSGTTQQVMVPILEDSFVEPDEFVNITIFGLSVGSAHAVIAAGAGTGTITIRNVNGKFNTYNNVVLVMLTHNIIKFNSKVHLE